MKNMQELIEKINLMMRKVTPKRVKMLIDQLDTDQEIIMVKAHLRHANKMTPEIEQVFRG